MIRLIVRFREASTSPATEFFTINCVKYGISQAIAHQCTKRQSNMITAAVKSTADDIDHTLLNGKKFAFHKYRKGVGKILQIFRYLSKDHLQHDGDNHADQDQHPDDDDDAEDVHDFLLKECSVIYECLACANLFRSVDNFITHKRIYCCERSTKELNATTDKQRLKRSIREIVENALDDDEDDDRNVKRACRQSNPIVHENNRDENSLNYENRSRNGDNIQQANEDEEVGEAEEEATNNSTIINHNKNKRSENNILQQNRFRIVKVNSATNQYQAIPLSTAPNNPNDNNDNNNNNNNNNENNVIIASEHNYHQPHDDEQERTTASTSIIASTSTLPPISSRKVWTKNFPIEDDVRAIMSEPNVFAIQRPLIAAAIAERRRHNPRPPLPVSSKLFSRLYKCDDLLFRCSACERANLDRSPISTAYYGSAVQHLMSVHHKSQFAAKLAAFEDSIVMPKAAAHLRKLAKQNTGTGRSNISSSSSSNNTSTNNTIEQLEIVTNKQKEPEKRNEEQREENEETGGGGEIEVAKIVVDDRQIEKTKSTQNIDSNSTMTSANDEAGGGDDRNSFSENIELIFLTDDEDDNDDDDDDLKLIAEFAPRTKSSSLIVNRNNNNNNNNNNRKKLASSSSTKKSRPFAVIKSVEQLEREIGVSILYGDDYRNEIDANFRNSLLDHHAVIAKKSGDEQQQEEEEEEEDENIVVNSATRCNLCFVEPPLEFERTEALQHHLIVRHFGAVIVVCKICKKYSTINLASLRRHLLESHQIEIDNSSKMKQVKQVKQQNSEIMPPAAAAAAADNDANGQQLVKTSSKSILLPVSPSSS